MDLDSVTSRSLLVICQLRVIPVTSRPSVRVRSSLFVESAEYVPRRSIVRGLSRRQVLISLPLEQTSLLATRFTVRRVISKQGIPYYRIIRNCSPSSTTLSPLPLHLLIAVTTHRGAVHSFSGTVIRSSQLTAGCLRYTQGRPTR